jgi:hypothetical protein
VNEELNCERDPARTKIVPKNLQLNKTSKKAK